MATTTDLRLRRSVLYMPGSNQRALDKAKTLPVDSIILDLEDAVAAREDPVDEVRVVPRDADLVPHRQEREEEA